MQQQRLGVIQSHPVPIVQGDLNPNLTTTVKRLVTIDSQYRQTILPFSNTVYNTDYILYLSEPLTNVLSMKLYSIQVPTTWYTFNTGINTSFDCSNNSVNSHVDISGGNYTATDLLTALNISLAVAVPNIPVTYTASTRKIKITNNNAYPVDLIFYQPGAGTGASGGTSNNNGPKINQHLGWNLGFRIEPDPTTGKVVLHLPASTSVIADAALDVYGSKYFLLVLDDFNNNHLNHGLVNITNLSSKINVPSYYQSAVNQNAIATNVTVIGNNGEQMTVPMLSKGFPRTLTHAQLYSANEIAANQKSNFTNRTIGPTNADVFALLPLTGITMIRPDPYVIFGPQLQTSIDRVYFGPVHIERLKVRLFDDKGNLVNLNDNDWSFSLIVEQLYQY
jgi:hypothetical protein